MKYLIVILMLCSFAQADSINFGVATHHNDVYSCGYKCNENNNLIAIEYKDYYIASFTNSYYRQSYLAAKKIPIYKNISFLGGISYGYDRDCLNPSIKDCLYDGSYEKELSLFGSFLIQKQFNNIQVSWTESLVFRNLSVGYLF